MTPSVTPERAYPLAAGSPKSRETTSKSEMSSCVRACPVCGGSLYEIRHKLHCQRCHSIVETCCEGGRG